MSHDIENPQRFIELCDLAIARAKAFDATYKLVAPKLTPAQLQKLVDATSDLCWIYGVINQDAHKVLDGFKADSFNLKV